PRREKERGFNQALAVARELSGKKGIKLDPHVLVRTRATPPQTSLEAEERKKNVRGAFAALSPEAVRGRTVLLVDDVFTTGSTLEECALTLRKAGAAEVRALTIAQA
ncbi:MAG: ComF family protein, partial [Candidatus Aminicenantales bacterium]